jgi:alpha-D-ribose 1-methylphosphonate 5-triphosphate diphosphatase
MMGDSREDVFTNGKLVLEDRVIEGTLVVRDGRIAEIAEGPSSVPGALDLAGDYLLPGLVELHTDNLEKHFVPRPGTRWPAMAAIVGHDAQVASAGITTVFDALCVGETSSGGDRLEILAGMANSIREARSKNLLRAEHLLHLRCEISHPDTASLFAEFIGDPGLKLVSIMDHTPGQRQFTTIEKYRYYYIKKHGWSDAEFEKFVTQQTEASARYGASNRRTIVALAQENGLTLASHDDATTAHVDEAIADGMQVAEFPTTMAAAEASREQGMAILMGAPNVVRGGSHSGNVSALDLAKHGLLDILSSDYVPMSLIHGAFLLARGEVGFDLPAAVRTVTATPAARVGLDDRGRIATGLRADLVRVRDTGDMPLVRGVWCRGDRVI